MHYRDVLRVAKAAISLLREHPITADVIRGHNGDFVYGVPHDAHKAPDLDVYVVNQQGGINRTANNVGEENENAYVPVTIGRNGGYEAIGLADGIFLSIESV